MVAVALNDGGVAESFHAYPAAAVGSDHFRFARITDLIEAAVDNAADKEVHEYERQRRRFRVSDRY